MKLEDRTKKWLVAGGAGIIGICMLVLITGQFGGKQVETTPEATEAVTIEEVIVETTKDEEILVTTNEETVSVSQAETEEEKRTTAAGTTEEVQELQPEATKPAEPSEKEKHDPTRKPNGEEVTPTTTAVPSTEAVVETTQAPPVENVPETTIAPTEESTAVQATEPAGEAQKEGQVYVPGFGWVDPVGTTVEAGDSDGDINKQIGSMD